MAGRPVRIANCSGFYGDRLSAAREMVDGGPIDVLTGDWLAELTMLILARNLQRDPNAGYARTFVTQMEQVMADCLAGGIKVVSNASLSPAACCSRWPRSADRLGLHPVIAYVEGDNLVPRMEELRAAGVELSHMESNEPLGDRQVLTANAYLGGWGIAEALGRGADIVVTGRVTDAALVVGPAAWHHGWRRDEWDALAGAVVAGHVIECGAQATGGNYSFFTEVPGLEHPGFPIAEVAADGSSVITKHPGHGGQVSVGTVTAQLLYEIGGPAYLNPDGQACFDSIHLAEDGPDRVRISGIRGDSPPPTTKVALNYQGGFRSTVTLYLTGLDIEEKAALVERALWATGSGRARVFCVRRCVAAAHRPAGPDHQRKGLGGAADHRQGRRRAEGGSRLHQQGDRADSRVLPRILREWPHAERLGLRRLLADGGAGLDGVPGGSGLVGWHARLSGPVDPVLAPDPPVVAVVASRVGRARLGASGAVVAGRQLGATSTPGAALCRPGRSYYASWGASSGHGRETRAVTPTWGSGSVPTPRFHGWWGS